MQTVRIQDFISQEFTVLSGVPEGSTLRPLLFVVFVFDIPSCVMSDNYGYADDFKLIETDLITIGLDLKKILKWCNNNFMATNFAKKSISSLEELHV